MEPYVLEHLIAHIIIVKYCIKYSRCSCCCCSYLAMFFSVSWVSQFNKHLIWMGSRKSVARCRLLFYVIFMVFLYLVVVAGPPFRSAMHLNIVCRRIADGSNRRCWSAGELGDSALGDRRLARRSQRLRSFSIGEWTNSQQTRHQRTNQQFTRQRCNRRAEDGRT